MGGTILGRCGYCDCQIDYDPLLGGEQFCDSCDSHFKLYRVAWEVLKAAEKDQDLNPSLQKLRKAAERFCFS